MLRIEDSVWGMQGTGASQPYMPSLRICNSCHDKNSNCVRRVIMVVCSDCETGNKTAFETIKVKLEAGTEDPELAFLSILPDCPHVGSRLTKSAYLSASVKTC